MIDRHLYDKFVVRYEQGWGLAKIAKNLGLAFDDIVGNEFLGRLNCEMAEYRRTPKIDTKKMYELIHLLEKRYCVGESEMDENGRMHEIKFTDDIIPNDDPQMIELRKVVNGG